MARYYFRKGNIVEADGKSDAAYEFYKKAYKADSNYVDAAFSLGIMTIALSNDTFATRSEKLKGLRMSRKLIDAYPADLQSGMQYAYLASLLDTMPESVRVLDLLEKSHPKESMIQVYKANSYGAMGITDSAINAIKRYERLEGMSFETSLRKLRYRLADNDTVGAIGEIDELIAGNPGHPEYISYKAKVYEMLEMPDSAFKYFNIALEQNPNDGVAKAELADIYAQRGDSVTYDRYITEALLSDNLDLATKTQILTQYLQRMVDDKADLKRSDLIFEKLAEQYPHEPEVLFIGARYAAAKHNYKEAIRQIDYAIKLDGQNPNYTDPKMSYLLLDGRPQEAMKVYEGARAAGLPLNYTASMLYISSAREAKKNDVALAALDSLVQAMAPGLSLNDSTVDLSKLRSSTLFELYMLSEYYQIAGDIYYALDDLPSTFHLYENALSIFPDNDLALNNYAYFLIEKGGHEPGSPEFEKAKEMSAKSVEDTMDKGTPSTYLDTYAWILFKEKNYEEALKYQKMAVEAVVKDSDDIELYSHYGDILFMNGNIEEAMEQWEKALKMDPDNALLKKKVTHKTYFEKL